MGSISRMAVFFCRKIRFLLENPNSFCLIILKFLTISSFFTSYDSILYHGTIFLLIIYQNVPLFLLIIHQIRY